MLKPHHIQWLLIAAFTLLPASFTHAEIIRGENGKDVNWTFNTETGVLSLYGKGTVWESDSTQSLPWYNYLPEVKSIYISSDVTYIGAWAFAGSKALREFSLPSNVTKVGIGAFYGCDLLLSPIYNDSVFAFLLRVESVLKAVSRSEHLLC